MKYIKLYEGFEDFEEVWDEEPELDINELKVGDYLTARDDFYMEYDDPDEIDIENEQNSDLFLYKDKKYQITGILPKMITINSELDYKHYFSKKDINEFFYI